MAETERDKQRRLLQTVASDIAKARLEVQRDPSLLQARDGVGETAFHYAIVENRLDLAQDLLQWGSDINTRDHSGATSLMHAVQLGYLDAVKWLVKNGADIDQKDESEETALSKATQNDRKQKEIFEFLLSLPRRQDINYYYDDLSAQAVFDDTTLVMRDTLIGLGLTKRFDH